MDDLRESIRRELEKELGPMREQSYAAKIGLWDTLLDATADRLMQIIAKAEYEKHVSEAYRVTVEEHGVGLRKPAEDFPIEWEE